MDSERDSQPCGETIEARKRALRARAKRERSALDATQRRERDGAIRAALEGLAAYREAAIVFPYLSFGSEVDTRGLIEDAWAAGKTVALPRVVEGERAMRWFAVDDFAGLERSSLGVEEPPVDPAREVDPSCTETAIALVPGLAFDARGFRLGYGGGFYDAFLAGFPGRSVGLVRGPQFVEDLGAMGVLEAHDLPVDLVVSEQGVVGGARR